MTIPQQFSLRWNNYSQHIVSALEDLRSDDEFTDVTLSCEGERLKAHKILLSACSTYFRDTFRENPCKHPVIILKGVIFTDLQAVVRFMYNGQVNVSQERLPSFLQTAELLQIKGLTDMNEKEDTAKKRNGSASTSSQNLPSNVDSNSRSATPDVPPRPPTPKRKRIIVGGYPNDGASSSGNISFSSSSAVSTQPIVVASSSNGPSTSGGGLLNPQSVVIPSTSSIQVNEEEFQDVSIVKYEDDDTQEQEDEYEEKHMSSDNDNSAHDMLCNVEPGSIGVFGGNGPSGMNATGVESSSHGYDNTPNEVPIFGQTRRGYPRLYFGPHTYTYHRRRLDSEYWRCSNRRHCKGRLVRRTGECYVSNKHSCTPNILNSINILEPLGLEVDWQADQE